MASALRQRKAPGRSKARRPRGGSPGRDRRSRRAGYYILASLEFRPAAEDSMDFRLTPEQETFRAEVRAWLSANLPPDWAQRPVVSEVPRSELYEFGRHWQRKLHEAGLLGLTWPKEFGGRGLTWMEELLLHEEMVLHRAPPPLN